MRGCKERYSLQDMMVVDSKHSRASIRRKLIKSCLMTYLCSECGLGPSWKGKTLSLVLDHINGVKNDHRFENLRWLCPNCNSQTETFSGRNTKHRTPIKFCGCGKKIKFSSLACNSCTHRNKPKLYKRKVDWPSKEELQALVWAKRVAEIAKEYRVSDSTICAWISKLGVIKPPRGYWLSKDSRAETGGSLPTL